jgi:1-acyl-sn-glycerol-3-phosphate acyltransferase
MGDPVSSPKGAEDSPSSPAASSGPSRPVSSRQRLPELGSSRQVGWLLKGRAYRAAHWLAWALSKWYFRIRFLGQEHVPASGPLVIAPVHRSNIDFLLMSQIRGRTIRFVAKESLFKHRILAEVFLALGAFPVVRGTPDRSALRRSLEVLERGEALVVFPEGTRRFGPVVEHVEDGAAYLAIRTGAPVLPIGIAGSEEAMPKGAKWVRRERVVMVARPPVAPPFQGTVVKRSVLEEFRERIRREMNEALRIAIAVRKGADGAQAPPAERVSQD